MSIAHTSDSRDLKSRSNLSGQLSLCAAKNDIQELLAVWHRSNLFPRRLHLGEWTSVSLSPRWTVRACRWWRRKKVREGRRIKVGTRSKESPTPD